MRINFIHYGTVTLAHAPRVNQEAVSESKPIVKTLTKFAALAGHGACSTPLVPVVIWNWSTNVCFLILCSTLHCEWCGSLSHSYLSGHHCLLALCPLEILTHPSAEETKVGLIALAILSAWY